MKKIMLLATMVAMSLVLAMPAQAQTRKDKKAAQKEAWEARQQFIKDSTERANKAKLDAMDRANQATAAQAAREEAASREKEAADKAKQEQAEKDAALQLVEYNEPCSNEDWPSTASILRGRGVGEELDQQNSIDEARQSAIKELASEISTKVQDLISRDRQSKKANNKRTSLVGIMSKTVTEVEETTGFMMACCKTTTFYEDGVRVFKTFYIAEIPADKVLKNVFNGIQEEGELLDMNYNEFKQEFNRRFNIE